MNYDEDVNPDATPGASRKRSFRSTRVKNVPMNEKTARAPKGASKGRFALPSLSMSLGSKKSSPAAGGTSPKSSTLSALTKKRGTSVVDPNTAQPSHTSFDLLEGGFATARNTRILNIGLMMFFAALFVFFAGDAVVTYVQKSSTASSITIAQSNVTSLNAKIAATTAGGQLPSTITSHHKARISVAKSIEKQSINFSMILTGFQSVAPSGSQITSITVGTPPSAIPPVATSVTTTTLEGMPPTTTTTLPVSTGTPVTIIYVVPSSTSAASVQTALGNLPFIVPGSVEFSGSIGTGPIGASSSTVTVTFIANMNNKADINTVGGL
jgi:hypothetical protein